MKKVKRRSLLVMVFAFILAITAFGVSSELFAKNVSASGNVTVNYYNGGFWSTMMSYNDFSAIYKTTPVLDAENDKLTIDFDVDASGTAWGPADAIADEYCDWSTAKSIVMEVKNNNSSASDFRMYFSGKNTEDKDTFFGAKAGSTIYAKALDGSVTELGVNPYATGGFNIPANFEGYVIFPVSGLVEEWQGELSLTKVKRVNFVLDATWSQGNITFGKIGYTAQENAEASNVAINFDPMIKPEVELDPVTVKYNNGGFWSAMMTNNDFHNVYNNAPVLDAENDRLTIDFDTELNTTAWGPADAIANEYCDWSQAKSIILEVKNNKATASDFRMYFSGKNEADSDVFFGAKAGSTIYAKALDGTVTELGVNAYANGGFNIPANFEGYIIFPVSGLVEEWTGELSLARVKRVNFVLDATWSQGNITFGKIGYTAQEGAEIEGVEFTFEKMVEEKVELDPVTVKYNNGGFWSTMMTNNDFHNVYNNAPVLDIENDRLTIDFDTELNTTAWGPADAIANEYCDWSQAKSIILEVKNNKATASDFRMYFSGKNEANSDVFFGAKAGSTIYAKALDGTVTELGVNAYATGGFNIPANFEGYIIFPVSGLVEEWAGELSLARVKRINFVLDATWSQGNITFGKVGYTAQEGAEIEGVEFEFEKMVEEKIELDPVTVKYNNGGFWSTMMSNNDFYNAYNTKPILDRKTDKLTIDFDVDASAQTWGPANAIADEYCDWSKAKSLIVEVKNNSDFASDFRMYFSGQNLSGVETYFGAKAGSTIYAKALDGTVTELGVNAYASGGFNIPANFEGYIIFPVSGLVEEWAGELSLARVRRINFVLDAVWSKGVITFGKVGYSEQEGAEIEGVELEFEKMVEEEVYVHDEMPNDLKVVKNWLYSLSMNWLLGQIQGGDINGQFYLASDADELIIKYDNVSKFTELWCNDLDIEDRDLSGYKYFVLPVRTNEIVSKMGFLLTTSTDNSAKIHYAFRQGGVYLKANNSTDMAVEAETEGMNVTIPANFNGYMIFVLDNSKMYNTYISPNAGDFDIANVGSINIMLAPGSSGDVALGKPMVAKSNKILDGAVEVGNIVDNDTVTAKFKITAPSKTYDGTPAEASVLGEFANKCTIKWYSLQNGVATLLQDAPVNAGEYKVVAKAIGYLYEDEIVVTIAKANPVTLIKFEEQTYYAKQVIETLVLSDDSIKGTINLNAVTLVLGENEIDFEFIPENANYQTVYATLTVSAVKASPAELISFEPAVYYAGQTVDSLVLATGSLEGTLTITSVKLVAGENAVEFNFVPADLDYEAYNGTYTITAIEPNYTLSVSDKEENGIAIEVVVEGYPFEYTLHYYEKVSGEWVALDKAPVKAGEYKVIISSVELGEGNSKEFKITAKNTGCVSNLGGNYALIVVAFALASLIVLKRKCER